MSIATLETRISAGQSVLLCGRCGWWAYYRSTPENPLPKLDVDAFLCPDCHAPLDGVEPPK